MSTGDAELAELASDVLSRESNALAALVASVETGVVGIARRVLATPGKVVTTGSGTSGIMAERLAHLLSVCGTPAVYLPTMDALHGGMGAVTASDLVLAVSKTGRSSELTSLVERFVRRGVDVVALTENADSPFAQAATEVVALPPTPPDADPGDMIAMASTLAVGAWGDALAVVPTMNAVLGVDSSTQSCKVEVRDADTGRLLGTGAAPHPPAFPPCSEQHPCDWVAAFIAATRAALASCERAVTVQSISVAAQCHGLVLLDTVGQPMRAAKLWNDTTGAANLARLVDRIGARRWVLRIGSLPTAAFTIAKLAWVAEHEPRLLDRVATILLPHDYLTYCARPSLPGRCAPRRRMSSGYRPGSWWRPVAVTSTPATSGSA
jgi:D-arabinose 5-phosphate isomerase GutQ